MLTVLIATHNGAETLPRVLDAHARLRPPPGGWKLVVVDNGSDDGSAAVAAGFADRLPLQLLSEPRRGKNRALNRGLRELAGDLAVFTDDDSLPAPDWLIRLRAAADTHPDFGIFGGRIVAQWDAPPAQWIRDAGRAAPLFSESDPAAIEGPCEANKIWGPNMAVRAEWFHRGHRFDERIGPDRTATYAMGGETELTLRLAIAERVRCWHCPDALVHHIVRPRQLTRAWILRRAFHLGRCVRRESRQQARAGRPHVPRGAAAIGRGLARSVVGLAAARRAADARRAFDARWELNLWLGCLYEALARGYRPPAPRGDRGGED
ncbi:glycosyltransferase family 2 protein [bacterium]|nr:glycosyltransferase family 2 protein [bacterium]